MIHPFSALVAKPLRLGNVSKKEVYLSDGFGG